MGAAEHGHGSIGTRTFARNDVVLAVVIDITTRDAHAAGEGAGESKEVVPERLRLAVDDADLGSAAGIGSGDDVGMSIAVDISAGDVDSTGEIGGIGPEIHDQRAGKAIEDANLGTA